MRPALFCLVVSSMLWMGCGGSDSPKPAPAPTPTAGQPAPAPTPTPTPTPTPSPSTPPTQFSANFGDMNCAGELKVNADGETGHGSYTVKSVPPNETWTLRFVTGHQSDSQGQVEVVLGTFTTDANGNASGTFNMSPGGYEGYFNATNQDRTKSLTPSHCESSGALHYSIIKWSQVTFGDHPGTKGTDPLAWGKADVTQNAQGHPIAAVELHGAAPNKTYHVTSGELSCAYSQGDIKTDANGDFTGNIDLFGSCEGTLYFYDDAAGQFVTGFVVK